MGGLSLGSGPMASRMRQSLREFEQRFHEETRDEREEHEHLYHRAAQRLSSRKVERRHRHGTVRFFFLVLLLVAVAVIVAVAMFETLYVVMG